jgi:hypothetical protein
MRAHPRRRARQEVVFPRLAGDPPDVIKGYTVRNGLSTWQANEPVNRECKKWV